MTSLAPDLQAAHAELTDLASYASLVPPHLDGVHPSGPFSHAPDPTHQSGRIPNTSCQKSHSLPHLSAMQDGELRVSSAGIVDQTTAALANQGWSPTAPKHSAWCAPRNLALCTVSTRLTQPRTCEETHIIILTDMSGTPVAWLQTQLFAHTTYSDHLDDSLCGRLCNKNQK